MKYLSLFSGIGGFEKGIQQAYDNRRLLQNTTSEILPNNSSNTESRQTGVTCIGFSEIDKYAIATYQKHYPTHHNYGDITKINADELPDFDLLVGGFPCQAFSIAGKRKGFEDTRGTLFFEIARILKAKQPRLFCLENVKGLLSHDNGATFSTIISTLDELGYDLQWQVLNSKNHGVPQNRERVFIIGHLRGTCRPKVFPFAGQSVEDTRRTGQEVSYTIDANYHKGTNTITKSRRQIVGPFIADKNIDGKVYTYPYTPPLRTSASNYNMSLHGWGKVRRLTPTECERLQGFPDGWTEGVSDTQRYKQCGNAVTVNVIRDIMIKIL